MTLRVFLLSFWLALGLASADDLGLGRQSAVTFQAPQPSPVYRGAPGRVELQFRVASGFHINSNQPKQEYLRKTELKLDPPADIAIEKIGYPPGQDQSFAFAPDEKLSVYSGAFQISVMVRPPDSVSPTKYMIRGQLRYQACDKAACYPPKNLPVEFEIKVTKGTRVHRANPAQSPDINR